MQNIVKYFPNRTVKDKHLVNYSESYQHVLTEFSTGSSWRFMLFFILLSPGMVDTLLQWSYVLFDSL